MQSDSPRSLRLSDCFVIPPVIELCYSSSPPAVDGNCHVHADEGDDEDPTRIASAIVRFHLCTRRATCTAFKTGWVTHASDQHPRLVSAAQLRRMTKGRHRRLTVVELGRRSDAVFPADSQALLLVITCGLGDAIESAEESGFMAWLMTESVAAKQQFSSVRRFATTYSICARPRLSADVRLEGAARPGSTQRNLCEDLLRN